MQKIIDFFHVPNSGLDLFYVLFAIFFTVILIVFHVVCMKALKSLN